ncbi:hypothetical protein [Calothrix sp. PCC 6303]|uniref:hypothetical protein n=1 Tax=Calothrix sp. PCC 6303 TaxID=1170562 RepID=UPI0002A01BAA|nr:hypothetical protein [Calothrix sp. PCC 6303]AFZ02296.1 hypothetical protein Cal6303_3358 [Calothrix sp. PCC 6303]
MSKEENIEKILLATAIVVQPKVVPVVTAYIAAKEAEETSKTLYKYSKKASKIAYKGFKKAKKFF